MVIVIGGFLGMASGGLLFKRRYAMTIRRNRRDNRLLQVSTCPWSERPMLCPDRERAGHNAKHLKV